LFTEPQPVTNNKWGGALVCLWISYTMCPCRSEPPSQAKWPNVKLENVSEFLDIIIICISLLTAQVVLSCNLSIFAHWRILQGHATVIYNSICATVSSLSSVTHIRNKFQYIPPWRSIPSFAIEVCPAQRSANYIRLTDHPGPC